MTLDLLIEAVNSKFANKFNSGSVLSNGKWYSVKKPVKLEDFVKGELVTVEIETKESKGKTYENIIAVVTAPVVAETPKVTPGSATVSTAKAIKIDQQPTDWDKIAEGKTKSLLFAAALQSPFLAMASSDEEFKKRSDELVNYFMSQIFGK